VIVENFTSSAASGGQRAGGKEPGAVQFVGVESLGAVAAVGNRGQFSSPGCGEFGGGFLGVWRI